MRFALELFAELRRGDVDHSFGALFERLAAEFGSAVFGDNDVGFGAWGGDAGGEARDDAAGGARVGGGGQGDDGVAFGRAVGGADEIGLAADGAEIIVGDLFGVYLAGEVH